MQKVGSLMHQWASDLFPITRSITGPGVRETLSYLKSLIPELQIREVPSGYKAFDWEVPDEWFIHEAWIKDEAGNVIVDFRNHNLHVVGYSKPVDQWMTLNELNKHLYSLPDQPDAIPYVTSFYKRRWGFCLAHNQRKQLKQVKYHVVIKSELKPGVLNYGELFIPGKNDKEVLLSTYICHPSMANNELSGPVLATALAMKILKQTNRRYTYRFIFVPETIGAIVYLSKHLTELMENVKAGFVLSCVGDERSWSYMPSRTGETYADDVLLFALKDLGINYNSYSFLQRGSDERQYCSPLVDLPVASVMRSMYGTYPEYHTSDDDLNLVTPKGLADSYKFYAHVLKIIENNSKPVSTMPCEPQFGKHGLYPDVTVKGKYSDARLIMNIQTYADGKLDLMEIFNKIDVSFDEGIRVIRSLLANNLISCKNPHD